MIFEQKKAVLKNALGKASKKAPGKPGFEIPKPKLPGGGMGLPKPKFGSKIGVPAEGGPTKKYSNLAK